MPKAQIDRIGQYIGQVRAYKGIALEPLAKGLCSPAYLCRIEAGKRETNKLLTDAFLQRLGSPAELFWRILDQDEFRQWQQRQDILAFLRQGDTALAQKGIAAYRAKTLLEQQFIQTAEINLHALRGAQAWELRDRALSALRLTQPSFEKRDIEELLLSQSEGYLLLAYLEQEERLNGLDAVEASYRALLRLLRRGHYDARERIYLLPYVACHVIEAKYQKGQLLSALSLCEDTLAELSSERRLYAYESLLAWKIRLLDASGMETHAPKNLLKWLQILRPSCPKHPRLLIPFVERGCVCCLNQVIRDRRELLGLSQAELAADICDISTLSRIESWKSTPQKRVRRLLLQKLHMSGERYDYEIIPEQHGDYILRSEIDRAHSSGEYDREVQLLAELRRRIRHTDTNLQFLEQRDSRLLALGSSELGSKIAPSEELTLLKAALCRTLPLCVEKIGTWPISSLSVNEALLLLNISRRHKENGQLQTALSIAQYVLRCLEHMNLGSTCCNDELYTRACLNTISYLGDLSRYNESDRLAWQCVQRELMGNHMNAIAEILYNIAWNLEHRHNAGSQSAFYLYQLAYAATLIEADQAGQQHIQKHCLNFFGKELLL